MIDVLRPFLSPIVTRRLQRDARVPTVSEITSEAGAMLFADLSGFTAMTETFAQRGPEGAELMRELLNAHFSPLVALIGAHGGEVVQFAGDATLAWFAAGVESDPSAALAAAASRAWTCATDIPIRLAAFGAGGVPLKFRVGVGAGTATQAILGGVDGRWEALLAGDPVNQAVSALHDAGPGEACESSETARLRAEHGDTDAPIEASVPPPEASEAARAFLSRTLLARLDAGQTDWLGEFRRVTTMFVGLRDMTVDESTHDQLQTIVRAMQTAVFSHEGTVNQLLVDDKGLTLLAAWGLSLHTHEDDGVRAVRAAIQIRQSLGALGVGCGIGIATGRAFAGLRGNQHRRDLGVMGDVVNVAARLMDASGSRIYCDAATRAAARQRIVFEALDPITLKGKTAPVVVYNALREKRRLGRDQREMIGRTHEREGLTRALRHVLDRHGSQVVILEGEPGIGKTRLVADLVERAGSSTLRSVMASGDALERSTPLHAWRNVFAGALAYESGEQDAARSRLNALLSSAPALLPFAPLVNDLLPLGFPETGAVAALTAEGRAARTRELLVHLFRQIAGSGAVLTLEDAHWFDSASWSLADAILQHVQPLLVVVVTRPVADATLTDDARRLFSHPTAHRMKLRSLDNDEIVALACQRLDVDALPHAVARLIRERSEGHPFFGGELAATLRDRGLVRIDDGECHLVVAPGELEEIRLPSTVEGIVTGRIDRLTPEQQITLKVASVFGRTFSVKSLDDVHPITADRPHLHDQLDDMTKLDLVEPDSGTTEPAYRFKHAIIEQVAYDLLPFAQRRQLHRAVAERYEGQQAASVDAILPLLAHHWVKAEDAAKAAEYLERAGQQALERDHNQEAAQFFANALSLTPEQRADVSDIRRAVWHTREGEAHFHLGDFPSAVDHLEQALVILGLSVPHSRGGKAWLTAREVAVQLTHLWRAPRVAAASDRARIAAAATSLLAWIHMSNHDGAQLSMMSLTSVNLAERSGAPSVFARGMLGMMATSIGVRRLGRQYFDRARDDGYRSNAVRELSLTVLFDAMDLVGAGEIPRALAVLDQALDRARGGQSRMSMVRIVNVTGLVHAFVGRMSEATRFGDESVDLLPAAKNVDWYHITVGAISIRVMGLSALDALALLETWEPRLRAIMPPGHVVALTSMGGLRTMVLLRAGRLDEAHTEAVALFGLFRRAFSTVMSLQWMMLWSLGATFTATWQSRASAGKDVTSVASEARAFARLLRRFAKRHPAYGPRALIIEGQIAALSGNLERARALWSRAADAAAKLGLLLDEGLAHYELGRSEPADSKPRRERLLRARALFAEGGLQYEMALVDAAL